MSAERHVRSGRVRLALCGLVGAALTWLAGPVSAAITYLGAATGIANGSAVTVSAPAGVASGDLLLVFVTQREGGALGYIATPAGWTLVQSRDNGGPLGVSVFSRVATAADATTSYTWTIDRSDRTAAGIVAFRGVDTDTPIDVVSSQAQAASSTYTTPAVASSINDTMLVALYAASNGNGSINAATAMTLAYSVGTLGGPNGVVIGASYATQAAAGNSGTKQSAGNTSLPHIGALVALRPAVPKALAVWRMDEPAWNSAVGEVVDSSGNGRHGLSLLANGTTPVATTAGSSPAFANGGQSTCNYGQFDRTSAPVRSFTYVGVPDFPALTSSFTFAAWIRSTDVAASGQRILVRDDADNGWGFSLGDGGSGRLRLFNRRVTSSGAASGNGVNPGCGVFCLDTNAVMANNTWYFVAASVNVPARIATLVVFSANGTKLVETSAAWSGTWRDGTGMAAIGGETRSSAEGRQLSFHFKGDIDEVQVYGNALSTSMVAELRTSVRPCAASAPDHYELVVPSQSLACLASTVTVIACSDASNPCTNRSTNLAGRTATLGTSAGALASTMVTFNASGVATTTLSHPTAADDASVTVTLSGEQTAALNPRRCCPDGVSCVAANSCSTTFRTAGFVVAATTGGAPTTIPTQTAGTASANFVLRAVRSSTSTAACEAALTGTTAVNWSLGCSNPTTCSAGNRMMVTGNASTAIAASPASTAVSMTFDANGNAPFSFNYADVGQISLTASRAAGGSLLSALTGASNAFVVRPAGFTVSGLRCTTYAPGSCATSAIASPGLNPAATSATGSPFVQAGQPVTATVAAVDSAGNATPNFGRETSAEGVRLTPSLVAPAAGVLGAVANASIAGGTFSGGVATVSNLSYSEVGIIRLTPSVADGNYLGTGDVTGSGSVNIGRFIPARFSLSSPTVTHRDGLSCTPASSFSHLGETFALGFTLTAQNTAGATTQNYASDFAKLDPTQPTAWSLAGRDGSTLFTTAAGRLALGSSAGPWTGGVASVTLRAAALRGSSPDGPFSAEFGVAPADSDGVQLSGFDMASTSSGPNDRARLGTLPLRFGRLILLNAIGAQDRPLAMSLVAQSWNGSAFAENTLDSCTTVPAAAVSFGNLRGTLTTADTAVGGATTLTAGRGRLLLSAPGGGRSGSVDLALSLGTGATDASCLQPWAPPGADAATAGANLPYLRGAWCGASWDRDPAARATFGRMRGSDALLYRRENF